MLLWISLHQKLLSLRKLSQRLSLQTVSPLARQPLPSTQPTQMRQSRHKSVPRSIQMVRKSWAVASHRHNRQGKISKIILKPLFWVVSSSKESLRAQWWKDFLMLKSPSCPSATEMIFFFCRPESQNKPLQNLLKRSFFFSRLKRNLS